MLDNVFLSEKYKQEIVDTHRGNSGKRFIEGLFAPFGVGSFDYDSTVHELKHIDLTTMRSIIFGVDFG